MIELSEKEEAMFRALGHGDLLHGLIPEMGLYRIAVDDAFAQDKRTPAAESLRRCWKAIQKVEHYRMTPEFDALIQL